MGCCFLHILKKKTYFLCFFKFTYFSSHPHRNLFCFYILMPCFYIVPWEPGHKILPRRHEHMTSTADSLVKTYSFGCFVWCLTVCLSVLLSVFTCRDNLDNLQTNHKDTSIITNLQRPLTVLNSCCTMWLSKPLFLIWCKTWFCCMLSDSFPWQLVFCHNSNAAFLSIPSVTVCFRYIVAVYFSVCRQNV